MIRSLPLAALTLGLCLGLAACASSGNEQRVAGAGSSLRVSLLGYETASFALVSVSHTARVELYSTEREGASTKVQVDEVMEALVERLDDLGYRRYARAGSAPITGGGVIRRVFEVERNGVSSWWTLAANSSKDEKLAFTTAMHDFLDLFNATQSFQSVENTHGGAYFEASRRVRKD